MAHVNFTGMKLFFLFAIVMMTGCGLGDKEAVDQKIAALYDQGLRADSLKDFKACIRYYTSILHLDSTQFLAHLMRGRALVRTGNITRGFQDFHKGVAMHPADISFTQRGLAYNEIEQYDSAMVD